MVCDVNGDRLYVGCAVWMVWDSGLKRGRVNAVSKGEVRVGDVWRRGDEVVKVRSREESFSSARDNFGEIRNM